MRLAHPLEVVAPTVDSDVLGVLAGADGWFTPRQIHTLAGARSLNGVRYALSRLVRQGIVTEQVLGQQGSYRLNREHLAATAIVQLAGLRSMYLQRLREHVEQWRVPPTFAALFGSAARGDMREDSDIDLFLVRPPAADTDDPLRETWDSDAAALASASTAWTGNDTRILQMTQDEVRRGLRVGDGVLLSIRDEGVALAGTPAFWKETARG